MDFKSVKAALSNRFLVIVFSSLYFGLPLLIPSWHGKLILVAVVVAFFSVPLKSIIQDIISNKVLWIGQLSFILAIIGLLNTNNVSRGLGFIETQLPLFFLPMIIYSSFKLQQDKIHFLLISFVAGVVALNLASLAFISNDLWDPVNLQSNIIIANNNIVKIHPAYVSLYLSFSIFLILDRYFPLQTVNRKKLGWVLFALVVLIAYLIWINSRTGILSFCVAFIVYAFYRFKGRSRIVTLSLLAVIIFIIISVPFSRDRFFNTPRQVLFNSSEIESSDPNMHPLLTRKKIFQCSIELIKIPEVIYGYGTGDFRDALNESFKQYGYYRLSEKSLDQHNEYFAQLHRHGIPGLVLFMTLLILPFKFALKYRSPLLAVFVILFAITALFENVFSAQKGVTFYALFCPLLMLYARKKYDADPVTNSWV